MNRLGERGVAQSVDGGSKRIGDRAFGEVIGFIWLKSEWCDWEVCSEELEVLKMLGLAEVDR